MPLILAALVLAAAPVHAEDDPSALAEIVDAGTVRVVASTDDTLVGTLLRLCESTRDPEPKATALVGTIMDDCFLPRGGCELIIAGVNPHTDPPSVAAGPDWMCIEDTIEELLSAPPSLPLALPVHLEVG